MLSNPKHGWCDFKLGNFEGYPSYLTDAPVDLLCAFIGYFACGQGMCWFDEEGTEFTLVLTPYSMFLVEEKEEPKLHDFSDLNVKELVKELIQDIESDITGWSEFLIEDDPEEIRLHRETILQKIAVLKEKVKNK